MRVKKLTRQFFRRFFQVKKIIVVTEESVDYYPMARSTQLLVFVGLLGFVSWASYSTGSFMSAQSIIEQKERTIEEVNLENQKIESQFSLLKRDLVKMHDGDKKELSEYTQFIIKQYSDDEMAGLRNLAYAGVSGADEQGMVLERINFLEQRVDQLKQENQDFVQAVREQTGDKIKELNTVIGMTGLKGDRLASLQQRELGKQGAQKKVSTAEKLAALSKKDKNLPQGGPLVPYEPINFEKKEKALFSDLKKMMVLYEVVDTLPLTKPLAGGRVTSGFGRRVDPFTGRLASHLGMDYSGPMGTKILATSDGKVRFTGRKNAYGIMVELDHGLGITTRYGHLSRFLVKEGQRVKKGQVIGIQGSTGRSTGNHVHYEVRYFDEPLNPIRFIKAGNYVSALN